jgi:hypothetical protein
MAKILTKQAFEAYSNNPLPRRLTDLPKEAQKARPRVRGLLQLLIGTTRLRMLGSAMRLKFARPQLCMNGDMLVLVGYGNLLWKIEPGHGGHWMRRVYLAVLL